MFRVAQLFATLALSAVTVFAAESDPGDRFDTLVAGAQNAQATGNYSLAASNYQEAVKIQKNIPELWANLGFMENQLNHYEKAISAFQEALRLKPALFAPNLFIGLDYIELKQPEHAIPFLRKAQTLNPADIQAPLALGRAYYANSDFSSAAQSFEHATAMDAKNERAWFGAGISQLREVDTQTRTLLSGNKNSPYVQALFAEALTQQGKNAQAVDIYQKIGSSTNPYLCSRAALGLLLLQQQEIPKAQALFEQESSTNPGCTQTRLGTVLLSVFQGSYADALHSLQSLWSNDHAFVHENLVQLMMRMTAEQAQAFKDHASSMAAAHELDEALLGLINGDEPNVGASGTSMRGALSPAALYNQGKYSDCTQRLQTELQTLSAEKLELLAACAVAVGDYKTANRAGVKLAARQPNSAAARYWRIKSGERLSSDALAEAEQINPNSPAIHVLLGDIYRRHQRYENAIAEYQKAQGLSPDYPSALLGLAVAYYMNANLDQAAVNAEAALKQKPDDPKTNLLMAEIAVAQKNYVRAEQALTKSGNVDPELQPRVHALLGKVYAANSRIPEAIEQLKQGLSTDDDGSIHYQLARLYQQTGEKALAAQLLQQTQEIKATRLENANLAIKNAATEWQPQNELP